METDQKSDLYNRIHSELERIKIIDCHEHLQRESELPQAEEVHIGRFFIHYANCDLVSAGMPIEEMTRVQNDPKLTPQERMRLLEPWYQKAWNTGYCEALRIALHDLYDVDELSAQNVEVLTERMHQAIKPGFTRQVFDKAGIDYALNNPFGPSQIFNPDFGADCFVCDMTDGFTSFPVLELTQESGMDIYCLDDYLKVIDWYFDKSADKASAFKVGRAYDRTLFFDEVTQNQVEKVFADLIAPLMQNRTPGRKELKVLEDFILHYLCKKCGEYNLRMKFHTGLQEGYGNVITNSRAALMANLFLKYPKTNFDIYHISYPYQDELVTLAKNFANVTIDFCWMWIINPAAGRRALAEMLDAVPANKIHGFGGDYIFVEGTYAHAKMARREIAHVLVEKIEEGRFSEDYAVNIGKMLLRENPIENFGLYRLRKSQGATDL